MTIEQYVPAMWFIVSVCTLIGLIGIICHKVKGGNFRKPLAQFPEIEYKNAIYIHMFMVYTAIMTFNVFAFATLPEKVNVPLVVVLAVIDVAMIVVYFAFMGKKTNTIILRPDKVEIQPALSLRASMYKYSDVLSADQNENGDITIKTNDGKEFVFKKMCDAKELLERVKKAK